MTKMKMKKSTKTGLFGILVLLLIGGWALYVFLNTDKNVLEEETPPEEPKPAEVKKLDIVDVNSKMRPFAIMINNHSAARKNHAGLQDAYIVYEMVVEGGITRFLALYKDQNTSRIGSVRSARHYFLDYALENDAIYVHHGNSPQALSDFSVLKVDRLEINTTTTGWRDKTLNVSSEHTLFTSIDRLKTVLSKYRTETNRGLLLNYSIDEIDISKREGTITANNISIKYSSSFDSQYQYDAINKVYKRSINGISHTDAITKKQYTVKNIIVYEVENYTIPGGGSGRQDLKNIGNGEGWYITNGSAIPITWSKASRSAQTIYKYKDGKVIDVNDGNTFIQIQPKGQKLVIS